MSSLQGDSRVAKFLNVFRRQFLVFEKLVFSVACSIVAV